MNSILQYVPLLLFSTVVADDAWQPLFPEGAPLGADQPVAQEEVVASRNYPDAGYRHTTVPAYKVVQPKPEKRSGAAVVILPGGGYAALAMAHEGYQLAQWLADRGIVGVIVKYRVSSKPESKLQFPVPLLDARCAIRTVRARAEEWGVDPSKVGVMGASAGGHLASMTATLHKEEFEVERVHMEFSSRPDFAILVYPVIAMNESWGHMGSRVHLIGKDPSPELMGRTSTHLRVDADTPPCFLVHAADDRVVPVRNSLEFTARCAENKVPVSCHVITKGGHGFGLGNRMNATSWTGFLERWLNERELLAMP